MKCQRYYQHILNNSGMRLIVPEIKYGSYVPLIYPTSMRAAPTVRVTVGSSQNSGNVLVDGATPVSAVMKLVGTSGTYAVADRLNITLDAEL